MSYGLVVARTCPALWQHEVGKVNLQCCVTLWLFVMFCLTKVRFTISPNSLILQAQRLMDLADPSVVCICSGGDPVSPLTKKCISFRHV